jgi:hypothetical protein
MIRDSERTHMRMSGRRDLNASSIEYFLVKDDDGGMPGSDSSAYHETGRTKLPYAVNLPSNKLRGHCSDHAIAKVVYV